MEYEGLKSRQFQINATLSVRVLNASGDFYAFYIAVRDSGGTTTILNESRSIVYIDSDAQIQNVAINQNTILNTGDVVEVHVQRLTGSGLDRLDVFSENLSIN